jgi:hypothetical protein
MTPQNPDGPVQLEVDYPPKLSRGLIFVKGFLAIPHFLALIVLGIGAWLAFVGSFFAVLFTGRFPEGAFTYIVGVMRWGVRVGAYLFLLTDAYPPFSLDDDPNYPVRLHIDYPPQMGRWRPLVNWILGYPAALAAGLIMLVAYLSVFVAWFAILFTGRYPQGLFNAVTIGLRWSLRVNVFSYWMTESYPPFVWA